MEKGTILPYITNAVDALIITKCFFLLCATEIIGFGLLVLEKVTIRFNFPKCAWFLIHPLYPKYMMYMISEFSY